MMQMCCSEHGLSYWLGYRQAGLREVSRDCSTWHLDGQGANSTSGGMTLLVGVFDAHQSNIKIVIQSHLDGLYLQL